jgi:hypothetical protein
MNRSVPLFVPLFVSLVKYHEAKIRNRMIQLTHATWLLNFPR